jgi:undecaprenyl-diphosphatase
MVIVVLLGAFGVVLGCAIAAGQLLQLLEKPDGSTSFDASITSWVVAHRTDALTTLAHWLSTVGSQTVLTPAVIVVALLLIRHRRYVPAGTLVVTWGGALGLYSLTKYFVHRPRPPAEIWLTNVGRTTSFPSGHATQSLATFVALAIVCVFWLPRARIAARILAVALAAGVGWSRVYLGVHWATDVGAGWLIAATWIVIVAWLATAATTALHRRRSDQLAQLGPAQR